MPLERIVLLREAGLADSEVAQVRAAAAGATVELSDRDHVLEQAPTAEVLAGVDFGIPPALFAAPGQLRWVHVFHAGVEALLTPDLVTADVVLTCGKGAHAIPIAEHGLAFMLAHVKELGRQRDAQLRGVWDRRPLGELHGKTLCVVGLGRIGRELARLAGCLGMQVVGVSRSGRPLPGVARVVPPEDLGEVLPLADFVALLVPLTDATRHLVGRVEVALMKPGAVVLNLSRGGVLDQDAVIEALKAGHLGGAAFDATDPEPLPASSELWTLPGVQITPHNSAMSAAVRARSVALFCENLRRYRAGQPLEEVVDKRAGY